VVVSWTGRVCTPSTCSSRVFHGNNVARCMVENQIKPLRRAGRFQRPDVPSSKPRDLRHPSPLVSLPAPIRPHLQRLPLVHIPLTYPPSSFSIDSVFLVRQVNSSLSSRIQIETRPLSSSSRLLPRPSIINTSAGSREINVDTLSSCVISFLSPLSASSAVRTPRILMT